jgi:pyruvate/2-oxoglutarate/acetoin dehydrogenase E1 component/TPP-dependent pyruvate/acetoin dehydrogenase alpha subunit
MNSNSAGNTQTGMTFDEFKQSVISDYRIACESRQASLTGRKEVLTGKAKFGIFGDGKEVAQLAMARAFKKGDFRSGYYRDQTFMFASGLLTIQEFFAQLYANPDVNAEPASAGRLMNGHFSTRLLDENGQFRDLTKSKNSSADISPTGGQMPRLLGLALASKLYRQNPALQNDKFKRFSISGNEVAFGTIGDASTSEGLFWETLNAAGVLQVPMAISVWDDGYGISVPQKFQTIKQSISDALRGFEKTDDRPGYRIFNCKGWDYPGLVETYEKGIAECRENHTPVLFHIQEMTQPQGHSTSGSHERYKSKERLQWEDEFDCIRKMREWMISSALATELELDEVESQAKVAVADARKRAWEAHRNAIRAELDSVAAHLDSLKSLIGGEHIAAIRNGLFEKPDVERRDIISSMRHALRITRGQASPAREAAKRWLADYDRLNSDRYGSHLYSQSSSNAMSVSPIAPQYQPDAPAVDAREILQANFDSLLEKYPEMLSFGEDVGHIGGVNQTWAGLQEKYGKLRVMDTGIREATIIGQGIGLALRGLRPIAEIQYLDYLIYALTVISDDLACLQYRTKGGQKAPMIISTRGHRLEGVWHSGSPISMMLGSMRGIYLLTPRNMTQAAGFYNTIMASDDTAVIIEPLNGYRVKEKMPSNIGEYRLPLGVPEVLRSGEDITIVTYGSCCRIVMDAALQLEQAGVSCEVVDVQTLLPFDIHQMILESVKKTNKVLFVDEDVPGGATAYMYQQVVEDQGAFDYLEMPPVTLSAKAHRPAYGSDGDYFSKPNVEDVFDTAYEMVRRCNPGLYPAVY